MNKNTLTLIQIRRWQTGGWLLFLASPRKSNQREGRPGLGLAERGAGRGARCRKKHCETGRSCCRSRTPSFADRVAAAPVRRLPLRSSAKSGAAQLALRAQTVLAQLPPICPRRLAAHRGRLSSQNGFHLQIGSGVGRQNHAEFGAINYTFSGVYFSS